MSAISKGCAVGAALIAGICVSSGGPDRYGYCSVSGDTNTKGERWAYPLWQQMIHQVNHATQHRSEAAMMLTKLGHSPGWLDLLYFVDVNAAAPQPPR